ncbi:TetR/AcrR family transcriptional regulator [Phaeobacter sp. PT47_59]|uniref:TetR/AcrR family transcriptional regulator n=1 Tax=Phaeobacter sp. PT47_59 TaxID=3029979 RepID=UPI00237FE0BE|nr:TetR/AcrR family transcriptional regulator [Phaeobacter sp. PT47_59]MDE4174776.1 TetR/AcrR family transcriptional regulator [Phaeobacter sp. PT47_59]
MPKIVDKEKMRAQIQAAARSCFIQKGYHATRMSDVAKAAGLAKGTLYLYFDSKDELILSLVQVFFDRIRQEISVLPRPQTAEAFVEILRQAVTMQQREMTALIFEVLGPGFTDPRGTQIIDGFFDWLAGHWAEQFADLARRGQIRSGSDPRALARAVIAMLDGLFLHLTLFDPDSDIATARREAALTLIATGLRGAEGAATGMRAAR